jgi:hypothetical protein
MSAPTDPSVIEAIEADYFATVYQARRLMRLRLVGEVAPPRRDPRAILRMRQASRSRQGST